MHSFCSWMAHIIRNPILSWKHFSNMLFKKLCKLFLLMNPANANDKRSKAGVENSSRLNLDIILANIQKFKVILQEPWTSKPMDSNSNKNVSMLIAHHLKKVALILLRQRICRTEGESIKLRTRNFKKYLSVMKKIGEEKYHPLKT